MDLFTLYNNVEVLVTGGCGFIGSHIVKALVLWGAQVTVVDNLSTGLRENIEDVIHNVTFVQADITDFQTCVKYSTGKQVVFHLAAHISVPKSMIEPYECHRINTLGTLNMLEAARLCGVQRFVFSSSSAVYGAHEGISEEGDACNPTSAYGSSKLVGEMLCKEYNELHGVSTVALRYFNVYGLRQRSDTQYAAVRATFMDKMRRNQPLIIFGDGHQTRDFVPVDTVVEANLLMGIVPTRQLPTFQAFNIASGRAISILELIDELRQQFPNFNQPIQFTTPRPGDVKYTAANCTRYRTIKNASLM
jgi:nucleoside-diphosphate-sugar epimerase